MTTRLRVLQPPATNDAFVKSDPRLLPVIVNRTFPAVLPDDGLTDTIEPRAYPYVILFDVTIVFRMRTISCTLP